MAELKMLTDMGFPGDMAREALAAAGGNVEMALEFLTSDHQGISISCLSFYAKIFFPNPVGFFFVLLIAITTHILLLLFCLQLNLLLNLLPNPPLNPQQNQSQNPHRNLLLRRWSPLCRWKKTAQHQVKPLLKNLSTYVL